jgi:hypothetical protein
MSAQQFAAFTIMQLRHSTHPKPGPSGALSVDEQDMAQDISDDYLDEEHDEPKKKRRKTVAPSSNKNIRGRRGKLRQLPEMPLDILFDVRLTAVMYPRKY